MIITILLAASLLLNLIQHYDNKELREELDAITDALESDLNDTVPDYHITIKNNI